MEFLAATIALMIMTKANVTLPTENPLWDFSGTFFFAAVAQEVPTAGRAHEHRPVTGREHAAAVNALRVLKKRRAAGGEVDTV